MCIWTVQIHLGVFFDSRLCSYDRVASRTEIGMSKEIEEVEFVLGDERAAEIVNLSVLQIRQLRRSGRLKGAWAKFGHRTVLYRPSKLKACVAALFEVAA